MPTTWNAIHLGQVAARIDPTEGNTVAENAAALNGQTFGSTTAPLWDRVVSVEARDLFGPVDASGRPVLNQNNNQGTDQLRVDLDGDGTRETHDFDAAATYNSTVTFFDGSSASVVLGVFQTTNGHLFLAPAVAGPSNDLLTSQAITSIRLNSVSANQWQGLVTDRPNLTFPCFAEGTLIATPAGEVPVEDLAAGDLVSTLDKGAQVIRWVGRAEVDLAEAPQMRPIRIRAGALGVGQPRVDLTVSPQHRVLVRSRIAQRMFGTDEVLVAARQLLVLDGVERAEDLARIGHVHFLFDRHEIVLSNGAATESLFAGPEALKAVGAAARAEILALFPDLCSPGAAPARPLVPGRRARRLAERHAGALCGLVQ